MTQPPMRAAIVPVTPLQQNCTLLWCTATGSGAFVDPGGDLDKLRAAARQHGVAIEKILITHGHIDHCGEAGTFAKELGVPIEGPHEADRFWISRLDEDGARFGVRGQPFEPDGERQRARQAHRGAAPRAARIGDAGDRHRQARELPTMVIDPHRRERRQRCRGQGDVPRGIRR